MRLAVAVQIALSIFCASQPSSSAAPAAVTLSKDQEIAYADSLVAKGNSHIHDDTRISEDSYMAALAVYEKYDMPKQEASTIRLYVGLPEFRIGDPGRVYSLDLQLIQLDREIAAPRDLQVEDRVTTAWSCYYRRNFTTAFSLLHEARALAQPDDLSGLLDCHLCAGTMYNFRGEMNEAIDEWSDVASLCKKLGLVRLEAHADVQLGDWLLERGNTGDYDRAQDLLQAACLKQRILDRSIKDELEWNENRSSLGECLATLGDMQARFGHTTAALEYYRQASSMAFMLAYRIEMADIYASIGDDDRAEEFYELAVPRVPGEGDPTDVTNVCIHYGAFLTDNKRYAASIALLKQGLISARGSKMIQQQAECLLDIGIDRVAMHQPQQAMELLDECLSIVDSQAPIPEMQWRAHDARGRALAQLGDHTQALEEYKKAIDIISQWLHGIPQSSDDPVSLNKSISRTYDDALQEYLNNGNTEGAFNTSEQGKSSLLALEMQRANITKWMTPQQRSRERSMRLAVQDLASVVNTAALQDASNTKQLAALSKQYEQANQQYRSFVDTVYRSNYRIADARGFLRPPSLALLERSAQRSNVVILDYVVSESGTLLFIIQGGRIKLVHVDMPSVQIEDCTNQLVAPFEMNPRSAASSYQYPIPSRRLYTALLKPAEPYLQGARQVCIVPDACLWRVPFESLVRMAGASPRYFIQDYPVSYAPAVSAIHLDPAAGLRMTASIDTAQARIGVVSNPIGGKAAIRGAALRGDISRIPLTDETLIISQLFPKRTIAYRGPQATKSAAINALQEDDIVHFCCHGRLNEDQPLYSALVMSPIGNDPENGYLDAEEIANLNINARLIVYAACSTGRGKVDTGQGLVGLTWASFVGGADECIATRWDVNDPATAAVMQQFYRYIAKGQSVPDALRHAELDLIDGLQFHGVKYQHPYYWSGLMLVER